MLNKSLVMGYMLALMVNLVISVLVKLLIGKAFCNTCFNFVIYLSQN